MSGTSQQILQQDDSCWRVAACTRARVLIDGADYFLAVRRALLKAEREIFIVGWDIDSRTPLVGPGGEKDKDDDLPVTFGAFLTELVKRRPELKIHLLLWDYSMLYALEREPLPAVKLNWTTPPQISVCLDDVLPVGASHHQKVVVVDDALAFSGGLDITIRRWDTSDHILKKSERRDPRGESYRPFHDIQMMVDGEAAAALAELVRYRWQRAACETPKAPRPQGDPWPEDFPPDFTDTRIGIARTFPAYDGEPEVREVEELFRRCITAAEKSLYIENQFLTNEGVCSALIQRLEERPELEVLIVAPNVHQSWLEEHSMNAGRKRFMERLRQAGVDRQVRLVFPALPQDDTGEGVMVHSKIMVVDDRLLRVGSANLNNRSMGMDTECDLALEAANEREREAITRLRNRLLAEHLGCERKEIDEVLSQNPSLFALLDRFAGEARSLQPIDLSDVTADDLSRTVGQIADPERPIATPEFIGDMFGASEAKQKISRLVKLASGGVVLLGLVALWRYTPLSGYTDPTVLTRELQALGDGFWLPGVVIAAFLLGSLVAFPVTVLIAVTGLLFSPLPAFACALAASLLSAAATYGIGRGAGAQPLRNLVGPSVNRVSRALSNRGVISVAALRMLPIAPFTFINLAAGASHVKFTDFIVGTFLGMAPGILVITLLGNQLGRVLSDPEPVQLLLFGGFILAWLALSLGLQSLATRLRARGDA
ncbi:VTT domain-containing protein [Pelagibius marinus]|uniref:VTT domain-containing protein n=1 Tax=Pelagibius marinus TaxID=2762760 RepID=UPI001873068A|nr:VTT domain-containing protein [Pelagibius marinus]